jgi:hypothetical protein
MPGLGCCGLFTRNVEDADDHEMDTLGDVPRPSSPDPQAQEFQASYGQPAERSPRKYTVVRGGVDVRNTSPYPTPDDAALAGLAAIKHSPRSTKQEYVGLVYRGMDGKGRPRYGFTGPITDGKRDGVDSKNPKLRLGPDKEFVGDFHNHPPGEIDDRFSAGDISSNLETANATYQWLEASHGAPGVLPKNRRFYLLDANNRGLKHNPLAPSHPETAPRGTDGRPIMNAGTVTLLSPRIT